MAQEIPTGLTGSWSTSREINEPGARFSLLWNDTIPTNNGTIPNTIWSTENSALQGTFGQWWAGSPVKGVISGCPAQSTCHAKIKAPTLFPTICNSHQLPLNMKGYMNANLIRARAIAPPLDHDALLIDASLILGEREALNLITGKDEQAECIRSKLIVFILNRTPTCDYFRFC